jgi:hypothetical protein
MINPEEFKVLSDAIKAEETLTSEQASTLLQVVYELDANLIILQNALELTLMNAEEVVPAVAEKVLAMAGRTDTKVKKKAATFAAQVTAQFQTATHMYLNGAYEQAVELLEKIKSGESLEEETTTTIEEEVTNENN